MIVNRAGGLFVDILGIIGVIVVAFFSGVIVVALGLYWLYKKIINWKM